MLNERQRKFVAAVVMGMPKRQAAVESGYSIKSAGTVMCHPEVQSEIDKRLKKMEKKTLVDAEYIIKSLKEVLERCMTRNPVMIRVEGETVQKTDANGNGVWEFDSAGANRAAELLGKHLKMFTDRIEGNLTVKTLEQLLDDKSEE